MYGMKPYLITFQKLKPCSNCNQRGWILKRFDDNCPSPCNVCKSEGFINNGLSETLEWFGRTHEIAKKKAQKYYQKLFGKVPYELTY